MPGSASSISGSATCSNGAKKPAYPRLSSTRLLQERADRGEVVGRAAPASSARRCSARWLANSLTNAAGTGAARSWSRRATRMQARRERARRRSRLRRRAEPLEQAGHAGIGEPVVREPLERGELAAPRGFAARRGMYVA